MDAIEDDARYPPNSYPQNHRHSHRPKLPVRNPPFHPHIARNFTQDDDDDEEFDEDEKNDIDQPMNDAELDEDDDDDIEDGGRSHRRIREDSDEDDDSSSESRGKRRRLDKFALGFEFAPRAPPPPPPKPAVRNSPPDWSEDSTFVLLDAWGDLFVQNGRKSLRSDEWSEVAKKVNRSSKTTRSDSQCRNRLDTLKKKYKKEKARMTEHLNSGSKWVYFKKMDSLMSSPSPPPPAAAATQQNSPPRLPCGVDAGEYVFTSSRVYLNRSNGMDEMRDSPGDTGTDGEDEEDDESDGLPPMMREKGRGRGNSGSSFRMLADSIQKFGEIYEKIENSKQQQMVELERMRKEFHRDLEAQKRQILERAQAEIARIRQEEGDEEEEEEDGMEDGDDEDDEIDGSAENLSG